MIFGLALSIGAVTQLIERPAGLADILSSIFGFGFSFLILALVWLRYSRIMSVLPVEGSRVIAANMFLLFLVSIEPYLYNLMTASAYTPPPGELNSATTTTLYALDLSGLMFILAFFIHELTAEERRLIPKEFVREYRLMLYSTVASAGLVLLSALPVFWSIIVIPNPTVPLRYFMWLGVFVANSVRRLDLRLSRQPGEPK
jgi:uncharacterized membrane protein